MIDDRLIHDVRSKNMSDSEKKTRSEVIAMIRKDYPQVAAICDRDFKIRHNIEED